MATIQKIDKRMEAESAALLKHLLELELRRLREENGIDMVLFVGVDGRVFSSYIPDLLNPEQFHLLNLVRGNMEHICMQLRAENLKFSIQQYNAGTVAISGVGRNAFLVFIMTREMDSDAMRAFRDRAMDASVVMNHLFESRPITADAMTGYKKEVVDELQTLSRLLFVEKFDQTRGFKKNMEIQSFIKTKLTEVLGVGQVEEVLTLTFNELGTSARYMTDDLWPKFVEKVVNEHVRRLSGDIIADRCLKTWKPEVEKKLRSFV